MDKKQIKKDKKSKAKIFVGVLGVGVITATITPLALAYKNANDDFKAANDDFKAANYLNNNYKKQIKKLEQTKKEKELKLKNIAKKEITQVKDDFKHIYDDLTKDKTKLENDTKTLEEKIEKLEYDVEKFEKSNNFKRKKLRDLLLNKKSPRSSRKSRNIATFNQDNFDELKKKAKEITDLKTKISSYFKQLVYFQNVNNKSNDRITKLQQEINQQASQLNIFQNDNSELKKLQKLQKSQKAIDIDFINKYLENLDVLIPKNVSQNIRKLVGKIDEINEKLRIITAKSKQEKWWSDFLDDEIKILEQKNQNLQTDLDKQIKLKNQAESGEASAEQEIVDKNQEIAKLKADLSKAKERANINFRTSQKTATKMAELITQLSKWEKGELRIEKIGNESKDKEIKNSISKNIYDINLRFVEKFIANMRIKDKYPEAILEPVKLLIEELKAKIEAIDNHTKKDTEINMRRRNKQD